jgi:hypothetical protein
MVPDPQIALDVEQLMNRIQHRVDAHPDSRALLDTIHECRRYADGVSEFTRFSNDLVSRTKFFIYQCLMRALKGNFERQRLFNHSLVNTLQLMAEDLDKFQRRLPTNNDDKIESR